MTESVLVYDHFDPKAQGLREALCTLGNGFFCSRGAFAHAEADEHNYPGTYLAGGYNRLVTPVAGREVENEDLVNLPNWLRLRFRVIDEAGGEWFNLLTVELLDFRQALDLKRGLLQWRIHFRDRRGRSSRLEVRRLVSMDQMHLAAQEITLTAEDWSGTVEIDSTLDGRVINGGVRRYRDLASSHLNVLEARGVAGPRSGTELCLLVTELNQARLRIGQAARTLAYSGDEAVALAAQTGSVPGAVFQTFRVAVRQHQPLRIEKIAALYTARDRAISEPGQAAVEAVDLAPGFAALLERHALAWSYLWARSDIELGKDSATQLATRLHIFHLLQTVSPNSLDLDIGVPARGWHGEAYRGHVFWDELFILPFLDFRLPDIATSLLRYRHHRLPAARRMAADAGYRGAMFPWQSGSDGREETQVMHLNPRSGRWIGDNTRLQRHVGLAICINVWRYFEATGARAFLETRGAEILLETARFFECLATYSAADDRYEIRGVMGPDEYHDAYPGAAAPGIHNNAYTNVLVAWLMGTCLTLLAKLDEDARAELVAHLGLSEAEQARWEHMSRRMKVCFHDDGAGHRVISQFQGYENLKELDWDGYRRRYDNIQRLDRILEAEGDSANCYKVSKQADVLMLLYLFNQACLTTLFERLGYTFGADDWRHNLDYYLARTSHGSTLSYVVHSWVLAKSRPEDAWKLFTTALSADIGDIQGGTTAEGIHLGAMAGTVDLVQRCFTGMEVYDGGLHFAPVLAERLCSVKLRVRYRGHWIGVTVTPEALTLHAHAGWPHPVKVFVFGQAVALAPDESRRFPMPGAERAAPAPTAGATDGHGPELGTQH